MAGLNITQDELVKMHCEYLKGYGFSPKITRSGDIQFDCEGETYILECDANDEMYIHLKSYIFHYVIDNDEILNHALNVANVVNIYYKTVKILILPPLIITASIGLFLCSHECFSYNIIRSVLQLRIAAKGFVKGMSIRLLDSQYNMLGSNIDYLKSFEDSIDFITP